MTALRPIEVARGAWGAALLLAPTRVLTGIHDVRVDPPSIAVARILGARQVAQAVLSGVNPSPEVLAMGVWVDAVHALSALALAALDRSRLRAGLTDAGFAGAWSAFGYYDLSQRHGVAGPQHDGWRDALARLVLGIAPGGKRLLTLVERARAKDLPGRPGQTHG